MATKKNMSVLLIVGVSGAGKTTVLHTLEDSGFRVVDGLPLVMLDAFVKINADCDCMAIGVDTFTKDFSIKKVADYLHALDKNKRIKAKVLYLNCDDKTIMRRYKETRRIHPFVKGKMGVIDGIKKERKILSGIEKIATNVIDTSELSVVELRQMVQKIFGFTADKAMQITVLSFSYRIGLPPDADLVFDVRCLRNPHYDAKLRFLTGLDKRVGAYIIEDADFAAFMDALEKLLIILLPKYEHEGKSYLTIAIGCTGGRHRSVFVAEKVAAWLKKQGKDVLIKHRELKD